MVKNIDQVIQRSGCKTDTKQYTMIVALATCEYVPTNSLTQLPVTRLSKKWLNRRPSFNCAVQ